MVMVLLAVLAVAPASQVKLALPGLRVIDITPERGAFYTEQLAGELITRGVRTVTEREISTLLGLERQKELLGCSDSSGACLVELANALGVDGVVLGDIAKIGNRFQVSLRVIDSKDGQSLAIQSFKAADEEALVDGLVSAADALAADVNRALGREVATAVTPQKASSTVSISRRIGWVPAIAAALALGGGAVCFGLSRADYAYLDPADPTRIGLADANKTALRGALLQTTSMVLFVTGSVFAVAAITLFVFGSEPRVSVAVTPSGASLSFAGVFP